MRYLIYLQNVSLLSLIILSACSSTNSKIITLNDQNFSSSETMRSSSEADEQFLSIRKMITEWTPTLTWSAPEMEQMTSINRSTTGVIKPGKIQTTYIRTTINRDEYEKIFNGASRLELDDSAKARGLMIDEKLDVDGVLGTQWGYLDASVEGTRYVIVSANGKDCVESADAPPSCPHYEVKVSLTSEISPDGTYDK